MCVQNGARFAVYKIQIKDFVWTRELFSIFQIQLLSQPTFFDINALCFDRCTKIQRTSYKTAQNSRKISFLKNHIVPNSLKFKIHLTVLQKRFRLTVFPYHCFYSMTAEIRLIPSKRISRGKRLSILMPLWFKANSERRVDH